VKFHRFLAFAGISLSLIATVRLFVLGSDVKTANAMAGAAFYLAWACYERMGDST
jgi:hypothetical protein